MQRESRYRDGIVQENRGLPCGAPKSGSDDAAKAASAADFIRAIIAIPFCLPISPCSIVVVVGDLFTVFQMRLQPAAEQR